MPRSPLSRRTVVASGLSTGIGVGLAGCSSDIGTPSTDASGQVARTDTDTDADGGTDGDQALVDDLLTHISQTHSLVRATRRDQTGLARRLRPLAEVHTTHAEALGGLVGLDGLPEVPARQRAALSAVRVAESDLRRRLVRGSVSASSGALALLLASMSAGLAQHLATLDETSR